MACNCLKILRFYIIMITANLPYISGGCCMGWTSPILPMLMSGDEWIKIDIEQGSWVVALMPLGAIVGPLIVTCLLDTLGRKWTIILDMVLHLASWLTILFARDVNYLYVGRVINGLSVGIVFTSLPVYISETADERRRNIFCSLNELFIGLGYLTAYASGSYLNYMNTAIVCLSPAVVFLVIFICAPETPYFLLSRKKNEKAYAVLKGLRVNANEARLDIEMKKTQELLSEYDQRENPLKIIFTDKYAFKEFLLVSCLLWCQQMSGASPIQAYAHHIFTEVSPSISPSISTIGVGVVQLLSSCVTPFIVSRTGVKIPMLLSCAGASASLGVVGICAYITEYNELFDVTIPVAVPCGSIITFMFFYCLGLGPLPWVSMSEILAPNIKGAASSIVTAFCFFLFSVNTKFYPELNQLGHFVPFIFYSLITAVSFLFVLIFLPNTKRLTLAQIQDMLHGAAVRSAHGLYSSIYVLSAGRLGARRQQQPTSRRTLPERRNSTSSQKENSGVA